MGTDQYIVSARKYRPDTFASMVGQEALTSTLKAAIGSGKTAHAYLFCGPRGVGKTSMARVFAKTINCLNRDPEGEACNCCESCRAFDEQRSLNIYELDAASNNTVDDIRQLIEQVQIPPQIGRHKIYIIDEVHMLSQAAFNAFLKTLEEPPEYVIFILATTEKHKILPTILSRCQIYDFKRISVSQIVDHLSYVAHSEGITTEVEALGLIAEKADGGMRDALSLFDRVANFGAGRVMYQDVVSSLNVLDYEYYFRLVQLFVSGDYKGVLLTLDELLSKGFDGALIVNGLASFLRDLLVAKDESTVALLEKPRNIQGRYAEVAACCPTSFLFQAIRICVTCDQQYRQASNKRLQVELALMSISAMCSSSLKGSSESNVVAAPQARAAVEPSHVASPMASRESAEQSPSASHQPSPLQQASPVPPTPAAPVPPTPAAPQPLSASSVSKVRLDPIRRINSGRLSVHGLKKEAEETHQLGPQEELHESFSEYDLQKAWIAFSTEALTDQVHLKNTMQSCLPKLTDKEAFEVKIYNPAQEQELGDVSAKLMAYLKKRLKNTQLRMTLSIEDVSSDVDMMTNAERIKHWREENPEFDKLYRNLNLREN